MYLLNDAYIGRSLDVYGEYSEGEIDLFRQLLRPGDVAIDVGANIGALTVAMARLVQPGGAIVAFEPQRAIFDILCDNLRLNGLANVTRIPPRARQRERRYPRPAARLRADGQFRWCRARRTRRARRCSS